MAKIFVFLVSFVASAFCIDLGLPENISPGNLIRIEKDIPNDTARLEFESDDGTEDLMCVYSCHFELNDDLSAAELDAEVPCTLAGFKYESYRSFDSRTGEEEFLEIPSEVIIPNAFRASNSSRELVKRFLHGMLFFKDSQSIEHECDCKECVVSPVLTSMSVTNGIANRGAYNPSSTDNAKIKNLIYSYKREHQDVGLDDNILVLAKVFRRRGRQLYSCEDDIGYFGVYEISREEYENLRRIRSRLGLDPEPAPVVIFNNNHGFEITDESAISHRTRVRYNG